MILRPVCLCFGATGPLYAGYMLAGGYSWRLFFYVEFAFGCALFILAFFVVEETLYHRKPRTGSIPESSSSQHDDKADDDKAVAEVFDLVADLPPRKTFVQTLKFWGAYDKDTQFFLMIARSFTYFLVPHVLWVITTYGLSSSPLRPLPSWLTSTPQASTSASAPSPSTSPSP